MDADIGAILQPVWKKLGLPLASTALVQVPYHGAEAVQLAVRAIVAATAADGQRPMSANIMIRLLVDHGMPEAMAAKLPSQIRKGAPMHAEWKNAFISGRFVQKLGRSCASADPAPPALKKPRFTPLSTNVPTARVRIVASIFVPF